MPDSIFTKIIKGQVPSYKVYEDENTFAFLDIYPIQPGHILVIPKKEVPYLWDMDDKDYLDLMTSVKKIGKRVKEVTKKPFVGIKVIGIDVPHTHVHVIPFTTVAEYDNKPNRNLPPDEAALKIMCQKLKFKS